MTGIYAEVQKIEQEQCTVQNYITYGPKYEHCPLEEFRNIMASSQKKKKKKTLYKCWLSPSRGDLFVSLLSSTKQTRVKFDSANMSPVSH